MNLAHIPLNYKRLPVEDMAEQARSFYELMERRRTVRAFSTDDVPFEIVEDIIRTAGMNNSCRTAA